MLNVRQELSMIRLQKKYKDCEVSFLTKFRFVSLLTQIFFFSRRYVSMQHEKSFMKLTKLLYSNFEPDDKCAQGDCGRLHTAYHQLMHENLFLKYPTVLEYPLLHFRYWYRRMIMS